METQRELRTCITAEVLADDTRLDAAFDWLCKRRKDWPMGADVWAFRRDWPQEKVRMQQELREGTYEVGLLSRVVLWRDGVCEEVDLWPALPPENQPQLPEKLSASCCR